MEKKLQACGHSATVSKLFQDGQCCEMGLGIAKKRMLWWAQTTEYLLALHTQGAIMSWAIR